MKPLRLGVLYYMPSATLLCVTWLVGPSQGVGGQECSCKNLASCVSEDLLTAGCTEQGVRVCVCVYSTHKTIPIALSFYTVCLAHGVPILQESTVALLSMFRSTIASLSKEDVKGHNQALVDIVMMTLDYRADHSKVGWWRRWQWEGLREEVAMGRVEG